MRAEFLLVTGVDGDRALDDVDGEKPDHRGDQCGRHPEQTLTGLFQRLGQQIEEDHAEHHTGGQAEYQVFAVADAHRDETADQRGAHGDQRQQNRHRSSMGDRHGRER